MILFSYILGRKCIFCGQTVDPREEICKECKTQISERGLEITPEETGSVVSLYRYEDPLRQGLHRFKYRNFRPLGKFFGSALAERFRILNHTADLVTCVPRAKDGLPRRYNQSAVIARRFAKELSLPLDEHLLRKRNGAKTQIQCKSPAARRKNAAHAYRKGPSERNITGMTVVLIDDLYTSGATAHTCAQLLKKSGAAEVRIYTAMQATYRTDFRLRLSPERRHEQYLFRSDTPYRRRKFRPPSGSRIPLP